jgi:hypothetical protein
VIRVVAVVVERGRARFFDIRSEAAIELPSLRTPATRGGRFHSDRHGAPGTGEHRYHTRIREEERLHIEAVIARLQALTRDDAAEILLAGPAYLLRAVRKRLPQALAVRVLGTASVDPRRITVASIRRLVEQRRAEWARMIP